MGVFNGNGDFSIWEQKMKDIFVQQKVSKAIDGKFPTTNTTEQNIEADELTYTSIILHLSNSIL